MQEHQAGPVNGLVLRLFWRPPAVASLQQALFFEHCCISAFVASDFTKIIRPALLPD